VSHFGAQQPERSLVGLAGQYKQVPRDLRSNCQVPRRQSECALTWGLTDSKLGFLKCAGAARI
jgi:hypothetical protein